MIDRSTLLSRRQLTFGAVAAGAVLAAPAVRAAAPARQWDAAKLKALSDRARKNNVAALMISHGGRVILQEGEVKRPFLLHSMRKSIMSALYGIAVDKGEIKLSTTVGELGIEDDVKLTDAEKGATLQNLIEARSGIYIPASAESPAMKESRPARGSKPSGTFWYYNNWDFNVLGEAYERITGKSVFIAFDHLFAKPLGMQDFDPYEHSFYSYERGAPRFAAYHMMLSARDMVRFGELYLTGGRWSGKQIISRKWIEESTRTISRTNYPDAMSGYGYLWWTAVGESDTSPTRIPPASYTAAGAGGHFLTIMPDLQTVVVVRVNTFDPKIRSPIGSPANYSKFLREVVDAHPSRVKATA